MAACKLNFDEEEEMSPVLPLSEDVDMKNMDEASFTDQEPKSPRRKLEFTDSPSPVSPPDNKIRRMKLFDSPTKTPRALFSKSHNFSDEENPPRNFRSASRCNRRSNLNSTRFSNNSSFTEDSSNNSKSSVSSVNLERRANINPFTPNALLLSSRKRKLRKPSSPNGSLLNNNQPNSRDNNKSASAENNDFCYAADSDDEFLSEMENPSKRIALREVNVSRYSTEFLEEKQIGHGVFGRVFLCRHRLDGCLYAIKKSLQPVVGSSMEKVAINEVYAHAVLGVHPNVVRYYSAWSENNHLIIQNEFCSGGSLDDAIKMNRKKNKTFNEAQCKQLLTHVVKGLRFIHYLRLAHLDIKPENIFLGSERFMDDDDTVDYSQIPETEEVKANASLEHILNDPNALITYKIGDLGHVTSMRKPTVEEGDCRYMARELLEDNYTSLDKVDIFALGLTVYEAATGIVMPNNGDLWHNMRENEIKPIEKFSEEFNSLIMSMLAANPVKRPSALSILRNPCLGISPKKYDVNKYKLNMELERAKIKNEFLEYQLKQAQEIIEFFHIHSPVRLQNMSFPRPMNPEIIEAALNNTLSNAMIRTPSPPPSPVLSPVPSPDVSTPVGNYPYNTRSQNKKSSDSCQHSTLNKKIGKETNTERSSRLVGRKSARSHSIL